MDLQAESCSPAGRLPDELDIARDRWERVRGCFPIELGAPAGCEWACATVRGGPCGNAGWYDNLVIMVAAGDGFARAGSIALADHGPNSLGFTSKLWIERAHDEIVLVSHLMMDPRLGEAGRDHMQRRILVNGKLVERTNPLPR